MQVFEITGNRTGVSREGVNFLEPADSYQNIRNGFIYRQVLQSRQGFAQFSSGALTNPSRVMGIFTNYLRDGTRETLICTKNRLYTYNTGTNTFDEIPIDGVTVLAPWAIGNNEDYVSGTTYPFADGSDRFVFTSKGMNAVYQYNGTNVSLYTDAASNLDYQAPAEGNITNAKHVLYFGERLNFVYPKLGANLYPQGFLFSASRSGAGTGDKYSGAGSAGAGLIILPTYEFISGADIFGDKIVLTATDAPWVVDTTTDAFNPYNIRRIPSVVGTNADFSSQQWGNELRSMGTTGIVSTDTRVSGRSDNKIPYFTRDDVDPSTFQLTYGGFDRTNAQFLWLYYDGIPDNKTQNKILVNNYEEGSWSFYDARFSVVGETYLGQTIPWNQVSNVDHPEYPTWSRWDTTEDIWNKLGQGDETNKTLAGDDDGFIWQLNVDYDDYASAISGITQAAQAVLTIGATPFKVGDVVCVENVLGMTQINNFDPATGEVQTSPTYTVVVAPTAPLYNTVTIDVDSTTFTAYASGGTLSKVIDFYAETIPFNPWRAEGKKVYVSFIEVLIDVGSLGHVFVDVISDEDEAPFIQNVQLQPDNDQTVRQWVSLSVNMECNFMTFAFKQSSPGAQVKITSVRIHASPGAPTSY